MELALNLAWALCSMGLVWFWIRRGVSVRVPRSTQLLALAMVVLLLLPVISLSDDLLAAQSPAESDSYLRRATERDHTHPSMVPTTLALPEAQILGQWPQLVSREALPTEAKALPVSVFAHARFSRPPPQG